VEPSQFATSASTIADSASPRPRCSIAIPPGSRSSNWIGTLWGGDIRGTTALHFAVGSSDVHNRRASRESRTRRRPADLQQTDTYYVVAQRSTSAVRWHRSGLFAGILLLVAER